MPVRSLYGTFAYVTCPMVLERLKRDLTAAGYNGVYESPEPKEIEAFHTPESKLIADGKVFFEDLDFVAKQDNDMTNNWAEMLAKAIFPGETKWQSIFKERFAIISDNSFNFCRRLERR